MRINVFRRMYRKIVVIDARIVFIGGLNYFVEYMFSYGLEVKQDYAVRFEGSIVEDIFQFELENLFGQSAVRRWWRRYYKAEENRQSGEAQVLLVWRDNEEYRDDIERYYLKMFIQARREVIIVNVYFFFGYRFLYVLRKAVRRGVRIKLIIQGESDMSIVRVGARLLYNYLVKGGVQVFEYRRRSFYGKVVLMDDYWAIVGFSNFDSFSLLLNFEVNVIIYDRYFNQTLRDNLNGIIVVDCQQVDEIMLFKRIWWNLIKSVLAFYFLRYFSALVGWFSVYTLRLAQVDSFV